MRLSKRLPRRYECFPILSQDIIVLAARLPDDPLAQSFLNMFIDTPVEEMLREIESDQFGSIT